MKECVAIFQPHEQFDGCKAAVDKTLLFNFTEDNTPVTIEMCREEPLIINEKLQLGTSEVVPNSPTQKVITETKIKFEV